MNLLLDSHTLLWWLHAPERLQTKTFQLIEGAGNTVFYSAASVWELELKAAAGKLFLPVDWLEGIRQSEFQELPVRSVEAKRSAHLPRHHRDPFDRLLIAQALEHGLHIATRDRIIEAYGVPVLYV